MIIRQSKTTELIEIKRINLIDKINSEKSLLSSDVIEASQELDNAIVQFIKRDINNGK